jgi:hypothetical protein
VYLEETADGFYGLNGEEWSRMGETLARGAVGFIGGEGIKGAGKILGGIKSMFPRGGKKAFERGGQKTVTKPKAMYKPPEKRVYKVTARPKVQQEKYTVNKQRVSAGKQINGHKGNAPAPKKPIAKKTNSEKGSSSSGKGESSENPAKSSEIQGHKGIRGKLL